MAFPEDVLTEDEHVVLHLHPHWKALIRPVVVLVAAIGRGRRGSCCCRPADGHRSALRDRRARPARGLLADASGRSWSGAAPTTSSPTSGSSCGSGVLSRERRDIPLGRINDHR